MMDPDPFGKMSDWKAGCIFFGGGFLIVLLLCVLLGR